MCEGSVSRGIANPTRDQEDEFGGSMEHVSQGPKEPPRGIGTCRYVVTFVIAAWVLPMI